LKIKSAATHRSAAAQFPSMSLVLESLTILVMSLKIRYGVITYFLSRKRHTLVTKLFAETARNIKLNSPKAAPGFLLPQKFIWKSSKKG